MSATKCTNRLECRFCYGTGWQELAEHDDGTPCEEVCSHCDGYGKANPCGDEGELCEACGEKERDYWFRYFGKQLRLSDAQVNQDLRDAGRGHLVRE